MVHVMVHGCFIVRDQVLECWLLVDRDDWPPWHCKFVFSARQYVMSTVHFMTCQHRQAVDLFSDDLSPSAG